MDALTYLQSHCRLRRNVLTGAISYAPAGSNDYLPLSPEGRNTILLEAEQQGVSLNTLTLDRYVHSTLIAQWNPATEWLDALPQWDGNDYVFDLSERIITSNPDWPARFHKWMLQMVARWQGRDIAVRDLIVPVLVGVYGYGKTSFCNLILPPPLRPYYTDGVHVKSSQEVYDLISTSSIGSMPTRPSSCVTCSRAPRPSSARLTVRQLSRAISTPPSSPTPATSTP